MSSDDRRPRSVNSQLCAVGYTVAVEYVFYVFFALCLLCTLSVLATEKLRVAGRAEHAIKAEHLTRSLYPIAVFGTLAGAMLAVR